MRKKKTAIQTNELISLAFYELLLRRDYSNIKVSDICEKAGVSRMTFYRHFNNKEDIFIGYSDDRFAEFYDELRKVDSDELLPYIIQVVNFFKKYRRQLLALKKSNQEFIILDQLQNYARYLVAKNHKSLSKIDKSNPVLIVFHTGGLFYTMMDWLEKGCPETSLEMANYILRVFQH